MRNPVRSERDAFRWVYAITAVIGLAIGVGALAGARYGVILLGGAALGALAWEVVTEDRDRAPLRDAARAAPHPAPDDRHHVLVIANETVGGRRLREAISARTQQTPLVRIVCPILPSRAHLIASDIDRELAEARARLGQMLAWAAEQGIAASGTISEEPPATAAANELRRFPADEVIVSTHPPERSRWLEEGLVERLREELDIPVHHVIVDLRQTPPVVGRR